MPWDHDDSLDDKKSQPSSVENVSGVWVSWWYESGQSRRTSPLLCLSLLQPTLPTDPAPPLTNSPATDEASRLTRWVPCQSIRPSWSSDLITWEMLFLSPACASMCRPADATLHLPDIYCHRHCPTLSGTQPGSTKQPHITRCLTAPAKVRVTGAFVSLSLLRLYVFDTIILPSQLKKASFPSFRPPLARVHPRIQTFLLLWVATLTPVLPHHWLSLD